MKRVFNYPIQFKTLPDYSNHRGQVVTVIRPLIRGVEYNYEGEGMYEVRAADGWIGHAFYSELGRVL